MAAQGNMKISVHLNCCIKVHLMNTYHSEVPFLILSNLGQCI